MEATDAIWYSCNEEVKWYNTNNNNNNNNNTNTNKSINAGHNNNDIITHPIDTQVTFNHSKASDLRQTRLQRQHEQQLHSTQSTSSSPSASPNSNTIINQTTIVQSASVLPLNFEKSRSSVNAHRPPRRKRLQRQKPTELDDADFAYAADLEEEDEEEELVQQHQSAVYNKKPLLGTTTRVEHIVAPSYAEKHLQNFQQQHNTLFDGQPSSLPNCFANSAAITTTFHHHHHHQHQQQQQQHHRVERRLKHEESFDSSTTTTTNTTDTTNSPTSPSLRRQHFAMLKRDNSAHSDSSSRYSSVDSLLEARKPDPEAILINLGFGPVGSEDILSRIPKRFLKPSQVRGIDTEAFIRRLQLANNLADHSVLGYRGLTGNPDIPPSRIVAKIMQRFEVNERKKSMGSIEHTI